MLWSALMCNKRALIRAEAELAEHEWVQRLRLVALIGTSVQTYQVSDRRFNPVLQPLFLCSFFFRQTYVHHNYVQGNIQL